MFPKGIWIEPTNICNLKCTFCFHSNDSMKRQKGMMQQSLYKKIIDDVSCFDPEIILHHSGESLLHNKLYDFIRYAKQKGLKVGMTTNGTLLEIEILDTGIDTLNISLAGVDEEDYQLVRPGYSFSDVVDKIKLISENRNKTCIAINVVITKHNKNRISQFKKRFKSLVDEIIVRKQIDWMGSVDVEPIKHNSFLVEMYMRFKAKSRYGLCQSLYNEAGILWDGTVVPCCLDFNGSISLGNINNDGFLNIWNGKKMYDLRKILKSSSLTKKHHVCGKCRFGRT